MDKKIKLSNGETITMRSPKVRDIRAVSNIEDDSQREFELFCNLTGLSAEAMDDLEMVDYAKLQEAYQGFLSQN